MSRALGGVSHGASCPRLDTGSPQMASSIELHWVVLGGSRGMANSMFDVSHGALCPRLDTGSPHMVQSIELPEGPVQCQMVWVETRAGLCTGHWSTPDDVVHRTAWGLGGLV